MEKMSGSTPEKKKEGLLRKAAKAFALSAGLIAGAQHPNAEGYATTQGYSTDFTLGDHMGIEMELLRKWAKRTRANMERWIREEKKMTGKEALDHGMAVTLERGLRKERQYESVMQEFEASSLFDAYVRHLSIFETFLKAQQALFLDVSQLAAARERAQKPWSDDHHRALQELDRLLQAVMHIKDRFPDALSLRAALPLSPGDFTGTDLHVANDALQKFMAFPDAIRIDVMVHVGIFDEPFTLTPPRLERSENETTSNPIERS